MKELFTYMFKMDNFLKNLGILYIYIFLAILFGTLAASYSPINMFGEVSPLFIIFLILAIFFIPLPLGYAIASIKNNVNNVNQFPEMSIKKCYIDGIKILASLLILVALLVLIFFILGFVNGFFIHKNWTPLSFTVASFSILILIVASFFLMASFYNFSKTGNILSFVKFPTIVNLINKNVNKYCKYFILFFLLTAFTLFIKSFLFYSFNFLGFLGLFFYTTLLSFCYLYVGLISTKIIANSIEE